MQVEVSSTVLGALPAEAERAAPRECCGLLTGEGDRITGHIPARNVHSAPETHFEIDPQALVDAHRAARAGGPQVVGYYHSHPAGGCAPSARDRACAAHDGRVWAIIAGGKLGFWRDEQGGFAPLSYRPHGG